LGALLCATGLATYRVNNATTALAKSIQQVEQQVDALTARMDEEVRAGQATFRSLNNLLCTIPGISTLAATTILAEIGRDMTRFPTAGHLLSLCKA